jgi:hypothetical protein
MYWMDRENKFTALRSAPGVYRYPAFSPDGKRLALQIYDGKREDIWVYEWERDTLTRLTFGSGERGPPLRSGYVTLKLYYSRSVSLESPLQPGSAAKAAFFLERSCPMESMAPV